MRQTPREDQRPAGNQHFIELSSPLRNLFQQIFPLPRGITDVGVWPALPPQPATGPPSKRKAPFWDRPPHVGWGQESRPSQALARAVNQQRPQRYNEFISLTKRKRKKLV